MSEVRTEKYRSEAQKALADPVLQSALAGFQRRMRQGTEKAYRELPEGPELRFRAHEIRKRAIENLDVLLERLAEKVRENGGNVFFAKDGRAAVDYCLEVAARRGVKRVVKGKSMVTEEIGLNPALISKGIQVTETDLGEFIIQLANEGPSHIIAPAVHKTREEIGRLFSEKLEIPYSSDPSVLTRAARAALRKQFFAADMGISGCNLACAETGHLVTLSNEGNIRMSTTLPGTHIAIMGMERIVARMEDYDTLLRLLSRGATGQKLATYVSYIGGPRSKDQVDGPDELHLIVLDNGRSRILADERYREILYCIRCAACLNACPVYGKIGGFAYGYTYSGPVGAVVTPLLVGIGRAKDLCQGESLCGACRDACPIDIDIPRMLLELRAAVAEGDQEWNVNRSGVAERLIVRLWSLAVRNRRTYEIFLKVVSIAQKLFPKYSGMIRNLPGPLKGWTKFRDIRPVAKRSFVSRWREISNKYSAES